MARISDVIFCLNASNTESGGVSANTILNVITPEYIPGLFTFSVIILFLDIDTETEQRFLIEFISPNGEEVLRIEDIIPVLQNESNLPCEYKGINLAMDWNNVNFKVSGEYTIKISINGELLKEKNIFVKGKNE